MKQVNVDKCHRAGIQLRRHHGPTQNQRAAMNMQESTQDFPVERNLAEAILDCKYGICFNDMNARLYRRMGSAFSILNLLGGSAIFSSAISDGDQFYLPLISGLIVFIASILDYEIKPGEKSARCEFQREKFGELLSNSDGMELKEFDMELHKLQSTGPSTINTLQVPAYNANLLANGFDTHVVPETTWQKFVGFFA